MRFHIDRAARVIRAGGIVAYPTEAVFGLGCLPDDREAVERLLAIKRRPRQKGFVLIAARVEDLAHLVELPAEPMRSSILATWPGPVTWALPARHGAPHDRGEHRVARLDHLGEVEAHQIRKIA